MTYICSIQKQIEIMTTKEIYKLANEMTEQEALNVVGGWENAGEKESIRLFDSLVSLGDSKELACATVISKNINNKGCSEIYTRCYEL